jgi:hypothetical protein
MDNSDSGQLRNEVRLRLPGNQMYKLDKLNSKLRQKTT